MVTARCVRSWILQVNGSTPVQAGSVLSHENVVPILVVEETQKHLTLIPWLAYLPRFTSKNDRFCRMVNILYTQGIGVWDWSFSRIFLNVFLGCSCCLLEFIGTLVLLDISCLDLQFQNHAQEQASNFAWLTHQPYLARLWIVSCSV